MTRSDIMDKMFEEIERKLRELTPDDDCPPDSALLDYAYGDLDPEESKEVEEHLKHCERSRLQVLRFKYQKAFWEKAVRKDMYAAIVLALGKSGIREFVLNRIRTVTGNAIEALKNLIGDVVFPSLEGALVMRDTAPPELEVNLIEVETSIPEEGGTLTILHPAEGSPPELRRLLYYTRKCSEYFYVCLFLKAGGWVAPLDVEPILDDWEPVSRDVPAGTTAVMVGLCPNKAPLQEIVQEIRQSQAVGKSPADKSIIWVFYGKQL